MLITNPLVVILLLAAGVSGFLVVATVTYLLLVEMTKRRFMRSDDDVTCIGSPCETTP